MNDETGRQVGSKNSREPLFAATGTFGPGTAELYEFGPFRLEPAERKLSRNNEPLVLTPNSFDTLVLRGRGTQVFCRAVQLISLRVDPCPAITISSNGRTGIRQSAQEIFQP